MTKERIANLGMLVGEAVVEGFCVGSAKAMAERAKKREEEEYRNYLKWRKKLEVEHEKAKSR